ncbi:MAG: hypothetical protein K2K70_02945 [Lachnospiraceae bacterium]|nr:hypothetical protein [Lachnospiraceae bacterium]
MIASTEHKDYQKLLKKGNGSILKAIRTDKGGGKGLIAGGIVILIVAILSFDLMGLIFLGIPAFLLLVIGILLKHKRSASWISYYQEITGYSESELLQIDRELASPSVTLVITPSATINNSVSAFFTEHYMVMNGVYPYVRRLEDFIAVAFSDSTDIWSMASLTKQDKETMSVGLYTDSAKKVALCNELMQELHRRNPDILCGQAIVCEGRHYILERDGAEILRLYQEGRKLELAK